MNDINTTGLARAALVNDLSCFGKCSLSVSIPIISSYGIETVPLPTAVLSTHTGGFDGYSVNDMTETMSACISHWKRIGLRFDCIYTGYLCSMKQLEITRRFIEDFASEDTLVIVDPVMGDNGALYPAYDMEYVRAMRALASLADVVTPNRTEAALLAGLPFDADDEEILSSIAVPDAVITSVRHEGRIGYLARMGGDIIRIDYPELDIGLHGAGDVFASALCGELMSSDDPARALRRAAAFADDCVAETVKHQPGHWYGLAFEQVLKRRRA